MTRYTIPRTAHCEGGALTMTQPIEAGFLSLEEGFDELGEA